MSTPAVVQFLSTVAACKIPWDDSRGPMRSVTHRYEDPLDAIWLACAERVGLHVVRSTDAYATTDGAGTLALATQDAFDADDCVAQMILHELCHWLVQGRDARERADWGLDNESDRDLVAEHGCLRAQAAMTEPYGLRAVLAPTTDHRAFYDALGGDPLAPRRDPSSIRARKALVLARTPPFAPYLGDALAATAAIVAATSTHARARDGRGALPSLHGRATTPHARHALVGFAHRDAALTCATCAWRRRTGGARPVDRCVQHDGVRVRETTAACERHEPAPELDCTACAACCREAYGAVAVTRGDAIVHVHPELLVRRGRGHDVRRDGDRCAALDGGHRPDEPYACRVYDDRPTTCRDFSTGGTHCLTARRRVGLSL